MTSRFQEIFLEVYEPLPRQGPGNRACAPKALGLCEGLPQQPRVLDLGCGAGGQTLRVAELTAGSIVAIDRHAPSIERLRAKATERGLPDRVEALVGDMADPGQESPPAEVKASFDEYPTMGTAADVLAMIEKSDFSLVAHFRLPDEAWWDDFYTPMERRIEELRSKSSDDLEALTVLEQLAQEPEMHRKHRDYYAYEFFVARRKAV